MDPGMIHQNCPLGVAWSGGLQDYLGNFRTPLARILYGRRRLRSRDPDIASFRFQLRLIRCIRNMAAPHCPNISFLVPGLWGPSRCYRCRLLRLVGVVLYQFR